MMATTVMPGTKRRSNPVAPSCCAATGLLRGACHRAALCADPSARNDGRTEGYDLKMLSTEELERYAANIVLREVGGPGRLH